MTAKFRWLTLMLTFATLVLADPSAEAGRRIRGLRVLTLDTPAANAVIPQNDPATGCALNPTYGYGFMIDFQWGLNTVLRNGASYTLTLQHAGAQFPALVYPGPGDPPLTDSNYKFVDCNSFIIDSNLSNWYWQVSLVNGNGKVLLTEQQPLSFGPCRLSNGQACNAP